MTCGKGVKKCTPSNYIFARITSMLLRVKFREITRAFLSFHPPPSFFSGNHLVIATARFIAASRTMAPRGGGGGGGIARRAQISLLINSLPVWKIPRALPRGWNYAENEPVFRVFHSRMNACRVGARLFDVERGLPRSRRAPANARIAVLAVYRPSCAILPRCPPPTRSLVCVGGKRNWDGCPPVGRARGIESRASRLTSPRLVGVSIQSGVISARRGQ